MKQTQDDKKKIKTSDFFEKFGIGEHLEHPSFALDDCDFEGVK
jgi:hypothetical protein